MIILEGPDGAGKSTLAELIQGHYNLESFRRGTADRSKLFEVTRSDTYRAIAHAVGGFEPVQVADRLYYSELVYADTVGRPNEFNPVEQGFIERVIDTVGMPVIVCMPPYEVARSNALKDEQMDGVNDNYQRIYESYLALLEAERFPQHAIVYDYTAEDEADVLDDIRDYIENYLIERRNRACDFVAPVS